MLHRRPVAAVDEKRPCRNGTEPRVLLPLWNGGGRAMLHRRPAAAVDEKRPCRNGTELRVLLPLRNQTETARHPCIRDLLT